MTEEEAKTKQCPHMRGQRPGETHCIASDCMMWTQTMIIRSDDDGNSYVGIKDGRCGLAK